jgi:hypothetical protein
MSAKFGERLHRSKTLSFTFSFEGFLVGFIGNPVREGFEPSVAFWATAL